MRAIYFPIPLLLGAAIACGKTPPAPAALPSATPEAPAASAAAPAGPTAASITGPVIETMSSGGYTYVKLATSRGDAWCAVPETPAAVGQPFTVTAPMEMTDFTSKTLSRTFDRIYFGTAAGSDHPQAAAAHGMPAAGSELGQIAAAHGTSAAKVAMGPPVKKADGADGRTIAEVFAQRSGLVNKSVAVRGRIAKYTSGVLGHNWLHLQDGSGGDGTSDITVTTTSTAAIGDVVTARGVMHVDRDFGGGYAYPVIIEDASLQK